MTEGFKEQKPLKSLKDAATEAIRFLGIDDPDAKVVFDKWKNEEDKEVEKTPEEDRLDAGIHSLMYEAEIYFDAGYIKKAIECLDDASEEALDAKLYDVVVKIHEKRDEYSEQQDKHKDNHV